MRAYLPAVLRIAERQRAQCDRLIQYCYDLDGTRLDVIEGPGPGDNLPYPQRNDAAFHEAAAKFAGKAFLWLEPDSVPTRTGWLRDISAEYRRQKCRFLLPDMSQAQKMDHAAGIGVYPPETSWLVPKQFEHGAWDRWLVDHMVPLIGRTRLIQHSYGIYLGDKLVDHRFPRDLKQLWPETLLFHRDIQQDLITGAGYAPLSNSTDAAPVPKLETMRHSGDLGDVISALPILRARGGGNIVLHDEHNRPPGHGARENLKGARYEAIRPLLEAQYYVSSVEWDDTPREDPATFRATPRPRSESLLERQARHVGQWPLDTSAWLTAPGAQPHDRVIVARSPRYHSQRGFPWREVAAAYKDKLLFVGLPAEHAAFETEIGRKVEHARTENLLDVARLIAGAGISYFNQSCPAWIAIGLGARMVLEVKPEFPNTSVMTNPRSFFAETSDEIDIVRRSLLKLA